MGKHVDKTKDYSRYRTLSMLPVESKTEYERQIQPDPVKGIDVHAVLKISSQEAKSGVEKELDVTVAGVKRRILVKVPAGIENGKYLRYREKGEPGKYGGQNGDLYIRIAVQKEQKTADSAAKTENAEEQNKSQNKETPVNGRDINCTLQITNEEWVKGVEKEKEVTIGGIVKKFLVKVPPAMQNGGAIRYRGQGEPGKYGGQNGDLYIRIVVLKEQKTADSSEKLKNEGAKISESKKIDSQTPNTPKTEEKKTEPSVPNNENSQICLENKGIPYLNPPYVRGNHYVTWKKK